MLGLELLCIVCMYVSMYAYGAYSIYTPLAGAFISTYRNHGCARIDPVSVLILIDIIRQLIVHIHIIHMVEG